MSLRTIMIFPECKLTGVVTYAERNDSACGIQDREGDG